MDTLILFSATQHWRRKETDRGAYSSPDRADCRREIAAGCGPGQSTHSSFTCSMQNSSCSFNAELELLGAASVLQALADLAMYVFEQPKQCADAGLLP